MKRRKKQCRKYGGVPKVWSYASSHPKDLIIGDTEQGVKTRFSINLFNNLAFISQIEQKKS